MTRVTIPALTLVLAASPALAQTLSPAPAPGLWETDGRMTVNGQDLDALMRQSMQAALKDMPPDQRRIAEQAMKGQGPGGPEKECLTPAEAARRIDARSLLAEMQKDAPQCRYEPVKVSGGTVVFKGRCADQDGFTGDITGEFTMTSAKAWTGRWSGTGRMAGDEELQGLNIGADGRVQFAWAGSGRWLAAACGSVKPH